MILTPNEMREHLLQKFPELCYHGADEMVRGIAVLILATSMDSDLRKQWVELTIPCEEDPPA